MPIDQVRPNTWNPKDKNTEEYEEGKVSDQEARELTIFFQQQVPFNEVELLPLIKEIVSYTGEYELPYTDKEVEERLKMLEFDWNKYQEEQESVEKEDKIITCPQCGYQFYK